MAHTDDIEHRVRTQLIEQLFRNAPLSYTVTLINAVLVYMVLDEYVPRLELLVWLIAIILVTLLRLMLASAYWNTHHSYDRIRFYRNLHLAGVYLSAALWSILVFLPGQHNEIWVESFIAVVIAGMTTGGVLALSPLLSAVIPYLLLILLPLAIFFFMSGDFHHLAMGVMVGFYLLLLIRLVFHNHHLLESAVRQETGSKTMFQFLEKAKQETNRQGNLLEDQITNLQDNFRDRALYFDSMDYPVLITGTDGIIRQVNPALLHASGMDEDDLVGIDISTLVNEEFRPGIYALLTRLQSGGVTEPVQLPIVSDDRDRALYFWKTVRHSNLVFWTGNPVTG